MICLIEQKYKLLNTKHTQSYLKNTDWNWRIDYSNHKLIWSKDNSVRSWSWSNVTWWYTHILHTTSMSTWNSSGPLTCPVTHQLPTAAHLFRTSADSSRAFSFSQTPLLFVFPVCSNSRPPVGDTNAPTNFMTSRPAATARTEETNTRKAAATMDASFPQTRRGRRGRRQLLTHRRFTDIYCTMFDLQWWNQWFNIRDVEINQYKSQSFSSDRNWKEDKYQHKNWCFLCWFASVWIFDCIFMYVCVIWEGGGTHEYRTYELGSCTWQLDHIRTLSDFYEQPLVFKDFWTVLSLFKDFPCLGSCVTALQDFSRMCGDSSLSVFRIRKSRSYLWEPGRGCSGRCRWPSGWIVGAAGPRRAAAWHGTPPAAAGLAVHLGDRRRRRRKQRWQRLMKTELRCDGSRAQLQPSRRAVRWSEWTAAITLQCWNTELRCFYPDQAVIL